MSKTVDDLMKVFNRAKWDQLRAGDYENLDRAGIAAVIRALAPDDDEIAAYNRLSYKVQEQLKCECEYLPEDRCIRCSVVDALKCLETRYYEILGDAGEKVATSGAIQTQGEAENGLRRSIEGPEGGAASGAFGLERQGDVVGASGAGSEQQDDVAVHLHRVPRGACGVPEGEPGSMAGVADRRAGRGLGDSSLTEKVAGACADGTVVQRQRYGENDRQSKDGAEVSPRHPDPATAPAPDVCTSCYGTGEDTVMERRCHCQPLDTTTTRCPNCNGEGCTPQTDRRGNVYAEPCPRCETTGRVPATDPAPAVCEWKFKENGLAVISCSKYPIGPYPSHGDFCTNCGKPIKFTEAK